VLVLAWVSNAVDPAPSFGENDSQAISSDSLHVGFAAALEHRRRDGLVLLRELFSTMNIVDSYAFS
jgi:hypothetical protein